MSSNHGGSIVPADNATVVRSTTANLTSDQVEALMRRRFDPCDSAELRLGRGLKGLLLLNTIDSIYWEEQQSANLPYIVDGEWVLERHPCNMRCNIVAELNYADNIENGGVLPDCRGRPFVMRTSGTRLTRHTHL